MWTRTQTRAFQIGSLPIGGGAPVSVQTMTKVSPLDEQKLVAQVCACAAAGADLVRLTVPSIEAAQVLGRVRKQSPVPLVADIHFDLSCALASLEAGVDALRMNPGNLASRTEIVHLAQAARAHHVPIRIGVNGGSLEKDFRPATGAPRAEALVASALRHIQLLEQEQFFEIAVSVKSSSVEETIRAYEMLAEKTSCPLHLGVTEAGTFLPGTVRSSVALGVLLHEGLGDTVRVSLTDAPEKEVQVGRILLETMGLRGGAGHVTSCPTCGRTCVDVVRVAHEVEESLAHLLPSDPALGTVRVAVMGCAVNGPGEARGCDVALCGGHHEFTLYVHGAWSRKIPEKQALEVLLQTIQQIAHEKENSK